MNNANVRARQCMWYLAIVALVAIGTFLPRVPERLYVNAGRDNMPVAQIASTSKCASTALVRNLQRFYLDLLSSNKTRARTYEAVPAFAYRPLIDTTICRQTAPLCGDRLAPMITVRMPVLRI